METGATETQGIDTESEPPSKRFWYLSSIIDEKLEWLSQSTSPAATPEQEEIERYMDSIIQMREEVDPASLWVENENLYLTLAPIACDLLTKALHRVLLWKGHFQLQAK